MMMANLTYMDGWFGLVDRCEDLAYVQDDFGDAVLVPFCLPSFFWQNH